MAQAFSVSWDEVRKGEVGFKEARIRLAKFWVRVPGNPLYASYVSYVYAQI